MFPATDRLFHTTDRVFEVVECGQCKFLRLSPQPSEEELKGFYPPEYYFAPTDRVGQIADLYRRLVIQDHVRFVRRALRNAAPGGPIIDVGCSGGLLARFLRDGGYKAVGLDNSLDAAQRAWRFNAVPVVCGDLLHPPLPEGSCTAMMMFHLLEHVPQPGEFIAAVRRLLKKDGRLIVQVPNAASWQFMLFGENWNGVDVPRHLWNFRASDLEWLLKKQGFSIVRRKFFSLRDNPAGMASSIAPNLDPMARRVRGPRESPLAAFVKNLVFLGLTAACLPFTALEAACGAGSTVMIEAKPE